MTPTQKFEQCTDDKGNAVFGYKRDVRSGFIYFIKMIKGHHFRESTGEKELRKAVRKANTVVADFFRDQELNRTKRFLCGDLIKEIIKRYEKKKTVDGRKNHTLNTVKSSFVKIKEYCESDYADQISTQHWDRFQDWFDETYPDLNTFNVCKYYRVMANFAVEKGILKLRPKIEDRNAKLLEARRKAKKDWVYTDEEIVSLDQACMSDLEKLVVRTGYQMGFRISESLSMEWGKINFEDKNYYWNGLDNKQDFSGTTPISDEVFEVLCRMPRKGRWVTPQLRNSEKCMVQQQFDFETIKKRASVTRGTPHALRHYCLSRDFKDPGLTAAQVCLMRRITLETAQRHYIHTAAADLEMLRNTGSLRAILQKLKKKRD